MSSTGSTEEGYNPNKSKLNDDTVATFLRSPLTGNLHEFPGIGDAAVKLLADKQVYTSFQLIAMFLSFKGPEVDVKEHCDMFWHWLKTCGIRSHRSAIVMCVAEKVNTMCPGIYDASVFAE